MMAADFRDVIARGTGEVDLPPGEIVIDRPMEIPASVRGLVIRGNPKGSTIVMAPGFQGAAAIVLAGARDVSLTGFEIRGNRTEMKSEWGLPPDGMPFADYYRNNGILVRGGRSISISKIRFSQIRAFPVLVNGAAAVNIESVVIEDSGTLKPSGRNNTTGGILLEEGVTDFTVERCTISRVTGTGIWTHSYAQSPRQARGSIRENTFTQVGRDAIQVGHATHVAVENNTGSELGFPTEYVDVETHGVAVALDTAGNVDDSAYLENRFTDVNGQCIDLDGFHRGTVGLNSCVNRKRIEAYPALHYGIVFGNNDPNADSSEIKLFRNTVDGFAYGGVFLLGARNTVEDNRLLNLNLAHCGTKPVPARCAYALDQPDLLRAGVYLANNGGRAAVTEGNVVRGNEITGFGIPQHCVAAAPGVDIKKNGVSENRCR
jgi:hypothetical protein